MTSIHLTKIHATGNDFLVWQSPDGRLLDARTIAVLCDRHRGVGADGLITMSAATAAGADCTFRLHNADGGIAEMSGNGMRGLALVAAASGLGSSNALVVDTPLGRRTVSLARDATGVVIAADVEMGRASFVPDEIPLLADSPFELHATVHGVEYCGDAVGMGNPHWVLFVDDVADARVQQHGPRLEHDERFPKRVNVEFVHVVEPDTIDMRVWERGVGETLSCGTGACAVAAAARRRGLVGDDVTVRVVGGDLRVGLGDTIRLGGPVVRVFDIDIDIDLREQA